MNTQLAPYIAKIFSQEVGHKLSNKRNTLHLEEFLTQTPDLAGQRINREGYSVIGGPVMLTYMNRSTGSLSLV